MTAANVTDLVVTFFGSLTKGQVPAPEVIKALVSMLLGYAMIAGSCFVKVPQIVNVLKSRSAEGLSALSFELETVTFIVSAGYGYLKELPFSAYGESVILCVQNFFLLALIYILSQASMVRAAFVSGLLASFIGSILLGHVSFELMSVLFNFIIVIMLGARLPQIYKNWKEGGTGQLSIITCAINVVGCVARLFTTIQEAGGSAMLRNYIIALALNLTLVLQILIYAKPKRTPRKPKPKAKRL